MKKKTAIVLLSTSLTLGVSLASIYVTYSWLSTPKYNFYLSTGDYPLQVITNIYLTSFQATKDSTDFGYGDSNLVLSQSPFGNSQNAVYNYKHYDQNKKPNVNGETISDSGDVTITFPSLSQNFAVNSDGSIKDNYLSDSSHEYMLKNDHFYVAFIEFLFIKQYFSAYLTVEPKITDTNDAFKYVSYSDKTNKNKTCLIDKDDTSIAKSLMNYGTYIPQSTINTVSNEEVNSDSNTDANGNSCYAFALVYAIYLDPSVSLHTTSTYSLTLDFEFTLSDSAIS